MKIKISGYPNRLICNLHSNHMNKKYGYVDWPDNQSYEDHVLEAIDDGIQSVYNVFNWIWFDRRTQKVSVKIDRWDTWSMDHTLAPIILPMLVQLKETKHGAPIVDDSDVPKELHMTKKEKAAFNKDGSTTDKFFKRWDWVMDEMIWAFEQKARDNWEEDYYGEWVDDPTKTLGGTYINYDDEGRQKHQERMSNGFKLFGKYYEALWD